MQYLVKASVFAALVASISALKVTSPSQGDSWDLSTTNTITWTSVSTDPTTFSIELVNMAVNPSVTIDIADDVKTSAGSYTLEPQKVTTGSDYQINLVSKSTNNEGILAQSSQFTVSKSESGSSSSSASSGTSSTSSGTSSGSTATGSASSTASSSANSTASSTSHSGSTTATSSSSTASSSGNAAASMHLVSGVAGLGFVGAVIALFA